MASAPLISVCLITYNHKPYIRQAIDSVLFQRHDFPWELVIADDLSSDGTREIVFEYKRKYPEIIKLIERDRNVGPYQNWKEMITAASGKYIAYLEGDDYWSDCNKIREQADFMEKNPSYIGCFHNSEERFEMDDQRASFLYCNFPGATDISFADLVRKNQIPSCSMFYRNMDFNRATDWLKDIQMGDWPLHLLNATKGNYRYMPKVMGVHRNHPGGAWMPLTTEKTNGYILAAYDAMIDHFSFDQSLSEVLKKARTEFSHSITPAMQKRGLKSRMKAFLVRMIEAI